MPSVESIVLLNTGYGKGKSSAAFGVMCRAWARGWNVGVIQFLKSGKWNTGERKVADHLGIGRHSLGDGFTWESSDLDESASKGRHAWDVAREKLGSGDYQLLILDELTYAVTYGWVPVGDVVASITGRAPRTNVIMTGRDAPQELVDVADTATEKKNLKHAFDQGIKAMKGAMNTHGTMAFNSQTYRDWIGLAAGDSVLGVAPLFHITGLIGHMGIALLVAFPLVINHRFEPRVVIDVIREHRPTFTVGSITVFINLSGLEGMTKQDWSSFRMVYSGGTPIAPAIIDRFIEKTGLYIHNIYGLTETNAPVTAVPLGKNAPVDPSSGALSVGVPVFNTVDRIIDEGGKEVPVGHVGEFVTSGPQVIPGYWNKPEATTESLSDGELRTGDVGFMDEDGWLYLVDRNKDMINAAGYKVWPREVEDVLYSHPAVREAAVVGIADEYRGETVKAYVSRKPGATVTEEELIEFCKQQMAAYKYPRSIEFLDELPKTTTGKILRRELRALNS